MTFNKLFKELIGEYATRSQAEMAVKNLYKHVPYAFVEEIVGCYFPLSLVKTKEITPSRKETLVNLSLEL